MACDSVSDAPVATRTYAAGSRAVAPTTEAKASEVREAAWISRGKDNETSERSAGFADDIGMFAASAPAPAAEVMNPATAEAAKFEAEAEAVERYLQTLTVRADAMYDEGEDPTSNDIEVAEKLDEEELQAGGLEPKKEANSPMPPARSFLKFTEAPKPEETDFNEPAFPSLMKSTPPPEPVAPASPAWLTEVKHRQNSLKSLHPSPSIEDIGWGPPEAGPGAELGSIAAYAEETYGQSPARKPNALQKFFREFTAFGSDEVVTAAAVFSQGSQSFAFDRGAALAIAKQPSGEALETPAPVEKKVKGKKKKGAAEPTQSATTDGQGESGGSWFPLKLPQVRVPPLLHRNAPTVSPAADDRQAEEKKTEDEAAKGRGSAATPAAGVPLHSGGMGGSTVTMAPAPAPPPFIPRPGETPAEALRRRLKESKMAVTIAPTSSNKISILHGDGDEFGLHDGFGPGGQDEEVEVEDLFKPNIFFQNARFSGMAPKPQSIPKHQQLPSSIYFFIRTTDTAPFHAHKALPDAVKHVMVEAKTVKGQESAGPIARMDFGSANVVGLGNRKGAVEMGVSQLVIDVPSHEAYSKQDPRVEACSLTFQPYQMASLHGDWLPRVNVPVKADRPRPASPETPLRRRSKPPSFRQDLEELAKTGLGTDETKDGEEAKQPPPSSPKDIGNPFAGPSHRSSDRSSRASLASERRLRESMRRMSNLQLSHRDPASGSPQKQGDPKSSDGQTPATPETPQSAAAPSMLSSQYSYGSRGSLTGTNSTFGGTMTPASKCGSLYSSGTAGKDSSLAGSKKSEEEKTTTGSDKSLAPTKSKLKAREDAKAANAESKTPGWMSNRSTCSIRSATFGVAGGPPDRSLWPRDFAADTAREQSLEVARGIARKALRAKREKEREEERIRRATRTGRRGGREGFQM